VLLSFEFISSSSSIRFECGEHIWRGESVWCAPIRSIDGGTNSFRLFWRLSGVTPPRFPLATLTALAALLMWLLLLPGILPAFSLAFSFALLTSSADILFFLGREEPWVVKVISGIKLVALVPRVASPSGVGDVFPGNPQHGGCKHCRSW